MFYEFPADITLAETREIVRRHNEAIGVPAFIEADRGDLTIFNYVVSFDGSFPDLTGDPVRDREIGIIRELRGLTFDKASGEVAIRKFHKFFNVGQRAETQAGMIDWSQPHVILLKEDGSMITPYRRADGSFQWHTKMGATEVAQLAQDYADANPQYGEFADLMTRNGYTPLFEFCSRKQKIVIDYPDDKLVLLAIRNNRTGAYEDYPALAFHGEQFDIPVVGLIAGSVTDPQAFLEQVRVLKDVEGYIVRFDNGHMVKIKAEDYLRLHNMVDLLQREKDVLALVLSDALDDAKPLMDDSSRERVEAYAEAIERGLSATAARLKDYTDDAVTRSGGDQKRLATEFVNVDAVPSRERGLIFQIARGRDPLAVVTDFVRKNISTGPKVNEVRNLIGSARWDDFRDRSVVVDD